MPNPRLKTTPTTDAWFAAALLSLAIAVLAEDLVSISQALDGTVYANIAMLLNADEGSIWTLPFYQDHVGHFFDHPPLGVVILQLWMAVFGDAFWAERALSLACLLLTLIVGRHILRATGSAVPTWWWCLLVLVMPITTHVAKNGYLEAQLTLLMFVGVLAGWQAYVHTGWRRILLAGVLGACTSAGLLIKGPVGLLPLGAVPAALWFYHKEFRAPAQIGTLGTLVVLATAGVVLAQEEARVSLMLYLEHQVAASISGDRPAEHERAYLPHVVLHNTYEIGVCDVVHFLIYLRHHV